MNGERIDDASPAAMRRIRGRRIGMVFQDPLTSLNPLLPIGEQIAETVRTHLDVSPIRGAAAGRGGARGGGNTLGRREDRLLSP